METGKELERQNLVKGYEFKKDLYLLLSDADFDSVKVDSSSVMSVEKFVDAESIDPVYYDASNFVAPDGGDGTDVYAVLREAIGKTGKIALTRLVMAQRERTVALRPAGAGLVAHTLYENRDLNSSADLFEGLADLKVDPEVVQLATQLIQRQVAQYDPSDLEDRYETRLRAMLDAKLKGHCVHEEEPVRAARDNVVDLMAALKRSLGQVVTESPPAASAATKPAKTRTTDAARKQPALKLPIKGGKAKAEDADKATQPAPSIATTARPSKKCA